MDRNCLALMSCIYTQYSSKPHLITVIHSCNQHLETRRTERNINSINVFQVHGRVGKEVAEDTLQCVPKVLLGAHTYMAIVRGARVLWQWFNFHGKDLDYNIDHFHTDLFVMWGSTEVDKPNLDKKRQ